MGWAEKNNARDRELERTKFIQESELLMTLEENKAFKFFIELVKSNCESYKKNSEMVFEQYRNQRCYKLIPSADGKNEGILPVSVSFDEFVNFKLENIAKGVALDGVLNLISSVKGKLEEIREQQIKKNEKLDIKEKQFKESSS